MTRVAEWVRRPSCEPFQPHTRGYAYVRMRFPKKVDERRTFEDLYVSEWELSFRARCRPHMPAERG